MGKLKSLILTWHILACHRWARFVSVSNNYTPCVFPSRATRANLSLLSRTSSQASCRIFQSRRRLFQLQQ